MKLLARWTAAGTMALVLLSGAPSSLVAQGVTSAAVRGTITREGGAPIDGAVITMLNVEKGTRQRAVSQSSGRYFFENLEPGAYNIEVRAIGFEASTKTGVVLALGQRSTQDFQLRAQIVTLEELSVTALTDPLLNPNRTGPASTITDSSIKRLPLNGRNFTDLFTTNAQITTSSQGGPIVAGQNPRFNVIQIDGGVNNDVFGLPNSGTPGGQGGAKAISIEALKEFQVLVAPFDVRQGGFSGGLINAVTKSGTNRLTGSLFGYFQNRDLVGKDTAGVKFAEFDQKQFGGTVGGPIIRDRAHFFVSVDKQVRDRPFTGLRTDDPTLGISTQAANRVRSILQSDYGFDPGGIDEPILSRPDLNVFAKLTAQLSDRHFLELSNNYVNTEDDNFARGTVNRNDRDGWQLSNSGYFFSTKTLSTKAKWLGQFGGLSTEVLAGYLRVRDARKIANDVPLILVQDQANRYIAAGGEKFSQANSLDQDVFELTANATFAKGNHQITVGTHNEFFSFYNVFWAGKNGVWTFDSPDALDAATPSRYEITLPTASRPNGPISDFGVKQFGLYVQDQWSPSSRVTLTFGVRYDVPTSDKPLINEALAGTTVLGNINTSVFPSGNGLFSPRFGFNIDPWGTGNTIVRGGVGIFTGRPPYVWMSNAFANTGLEQVTLVCTGANVPGFTVDVNAQPTACNTGGPPIPPAATINFFDEDFKFQQSLKIALGVDRRLPGGLVASLDFLHSMAKNQMYLTDRNLVEGDANGEGRVMYGSISGTGSATPNRLTSAYRQVVRHENRSLDKSTLVTGQIQKRFSNNFEFSAAYTWSKTEDVMTLGSSVATSNLQNTVLYGTINERRLATSGLDTPHKIAISGTANLPIGFTASLIYNGRSGRPYTYITDGDANADGISTNDPIYVPRDANDISLTNAADWDRLNTFIVGEKCLLEQRGQLLERNTCRNPWVHLVNFRLGKVIPTIGGQQMEITADVFNLLNLVNSDWGLVRSNFGDALEFEQKTGILTVAGWDTRGTATTADDRPRYTVRSPVPFRDRARLDDSRWRIQLGAKYVW